MVAFNCYGNDWVRDRRKQAQGPGASAEHRAETQIQPRASGAAKRAERRDVTGYALYRPHGENYRFSKASALHFIY